MTKRLVAKTVSVGKFCAGRLSGASDINQKKTIDSILNFAQRHLQTFLLLMLQTVRRHRDGNVEIFLFLTNRKSSAKTILG